MAVSHDGNQIEVGHVGRDGITGESVVNGVDHTPNRTFIQVAGSAYRIRTSELLEAMKTSCLAPAFHAGLHDPVGPCRIG